VIYKVLIKKFATVIFRRNQQETLHVEGNESGCYNRERPTRIRSGEIWFG
jgi:hypothetical protein